MRQNLTTTLALLALLAAAPLLSACNTAEGAGRDIAAVGHAMTNSAEKHAP